MQRIWIGKQPNGKIAFGVRSLGFVWEHGSVLIWYRNGPKTLGYKLVRLY